MPEFENTPYQENKTKKAIEPLSDFLGGVQRDRGGVKKEFEPYVKNEGRKTPALSNTLINLQEARGDDVAPPAANNQGDVVDGVYVGPNQRYFMGASSEPPMIITTKVTPDKVHYYLFPYRKEQILKKEIAADLFKTGSKVWLRDPKSRKDEELRTSIKSVLSGTPGEKVSLDDYQFSNVQIKYIGPKDGDLEPWKELEAQFEVRVDSVLTNKQVYNLRLNNRELEAFRLKLQKSKPRSFKMTKIISEEREYMLEGKGSGVPKLKLVRHKVHPAEKGEWGEILNNNRANSYAAEDWIAGQPVLWDGQPWFVVDFAPSGEEMTSILITTDFDEVAQFVPLKELKAHTPQEMGPDDDEIPEPEKIKVTDINKDPEDKKQKKPKGYCGKEVEGVAVDETPKERELSLPESGEDGETQEQKALKEDIQPVGKVKQLITCIDNDPVLGGKEGRFKVIVNNLLRKQKEGIYEPKLAAKAFETLADMGARKCVTGSSNPDAVFPRSIRLKTADALRERFEQELQMGNLKEMQSTDEIIDSHIKNLIESTEQQVTEAVEKEAVPFTEREVLELKKFENVDVSTENVATYDWNSSGKNYKTEITKKPRPQTNDIVYSAVSTFNSNQLDRDRTTDSDPFKTEDDVVILADFLSTLKLNEGMDEAEDCPDTTGEADKKSVTAADVNPEELAMGVKVEMEHTKDKKLAKEIALDHLAELPNYYSKLQKIEPQHEEKEMTEEDPERGEGQSLEDYFKVLQKFFGENTFKFKSEPKKVTVDFRYIYWVAKEAEKRFRAMMKDKGITEEPTSLKVNPDGFYGNVIAEYPKDESIEESGKILTPPSSAKSVLTNISSVSEESEDLEGKVVEWLKGHENPDDKEVHAFADELGVSAHNLEKVFYKLASAHVSQSVQTEESGKFAVMDDGARIIKEFDAQDKAEEFAEKTSKGKGNKEYYVIDLSTLKNNEDPIETSTVSAFANGSLLESSELDEEGSAEKFKKEKDSKKKKDKKEKKEPSHTQTKQVNALPVRDGRKVRTEVIGDVRIVYKTFEEKRKKDLEKKKESKKDKKGD